MLSVESERAESRPRFPALDPEPPRRQWQRRRVIPVAALAGAVGLAALGYALVPAGSRPHVTPRRPASFGGMILAESRDGVLTLTDLRTERVARLTKLGRLPTSPPPAVSADGKFVVAPAAGDVISLSDPAKPAKIKTALSLNVDSSPYLTSPFANQDASLIVQATRHGLPIASAPTSIQSMATGRAVSLGIADRVAGDPQTAGAFASVARAGVQPTAGKAVPDSRIELRTAGLPARVLATAARLGHVLGIRAVNALTLTPVPNARGTMVAVEVRPVGRHGSSGIVVINRVGRVLGAESVGPGGTPTVAWTRSGASLANIGLGSYSPELTQWTIGGGSTTGMFPAGTRRIGRCVWSPDGLSVLCMAGRNGTWLIMQSGRVEQLRGHGTVLAWLPGGLGG
jgi:hypothetical protein